MRIFRFFANAAFIFGALFILNSCEVGLGESVDVTAPVLEISSPADGSIIMNTFKMRGVGYDDTNIALIKVSVKSTSNGKEYASYYATADAFTKQWSVDINNKSKDANGNSKYEIPDGEYTVTVTAMDSAGRTTEKSRVYRIDNTPPVVVIKRPGAADSFGRTIKLTGDIADTNSLSSLYFTAFRKKEDGSLEKIRTIRQANISGVGLEYVIGKKYDNPANDNEIQLNNLYKELYGKEGYDGTSTLYCMVEVADCAREYEAPASEVRLPAGGEYTEAGFAPSGNLSRGFFVYNTIYSTIYSDKGYGLANSDLVSIYNGSYTGSKAGAMNEIKSYLEQNMMTTTGEPSAERMSMFTVNPNNFPYYEVSGYKYEADSSGVKKFSSLSNESKITVTVAPGRDQIDLDEKTVKLLLKKCNDNGEVIEGDDAETVVLVHSQTEIDAMTDDEEKAEAQKVRDAALSKDDTIKIVTGIGKRKTKCNYLVVVDGTDIDGNGIEASDGEKFGFFVVSVNKPPIISITEGPEDLSIAKDCNFTKFSGNVTMYADEVSLYCSITAKDEKGDAVYPVEPKEVKIPVDPKDFTWELKLTDENVRNQFGVTGVPENSLYLYTISFRAVDNDENESGDTVRRVHVDTEAPKVEKINISPINTFNDRNCVNGKISISANVSENYELDRMHVYLKVGDNKCYDMSSSNLTLDFNYDTKLLKKNGTNEDYEGDLVVEVRAMDTAGNWSEVKTEKIYVNQESDKPVIRFSNTNEKINDASKIKQSSNEILNLFDKTGNNKIIANITDDDEVDQVVMRYKKLSDPDTDENWHVFVNESGLGTTSYPLSATLVVEPGKDDILEEGLYNIRYEITDKKTNGELPVQISNEFVIGIDAAAPTLHRTTASGAFIGENSNFVVKGTLEEGSGKVELTRNGTKENIVITPKGDSNTSWDWIYNGKAGTEGDSYTFRAVDKFGKVTEQAFSYKVDNTNPLVELESSGETVYLGTNLSTLMAFKGTAEDPVYKASDGKVIKTEDYENLTEEQKAEYHTVDASGINHVEYTINGGKDWIAASGTTKWSANIDFKDSFKDFKDSFKDADNKKIEVRFRAVDNSNLAGEEKTSTVVIDSVLPEITDLMICEVDSNNGETKIDAQSGSYYIKENSKFVIKGTLKEKNFDKITCSAGKDVSVSKILDSDDEYSFSYLVEKAEKGTMAYTFTAVDLAGQSKSSASINVFVDGEAPKPEFTAVTPIVIDGSINYVNGIINISGTASDNDKVAKTYLVVTVGGEEKAKFDVTGSTTDTNDAVTTVSGSAAERFNLVVDTTKYTSAEDLKEEKALTLQLVSVDRAGISGSTPYSSLFIKQSTDNPQIKFTNLDESVTDGASVQVGTNLFETSGNNKLLGTVTDDDGVKTILFEYKNMDKNKNMDKTYGESDTGWRTLASIDAGGSTSYGFTVELPSVMDEGLYQIRYTVTDDESKKSGEAAVSSTNAGSEFYIGIDNGNPVITILGVPKGTDPETYHVSGGFLGANTALSIVGTVTDGNLIGLTITKSVEESEAPGEIEITGTDTTKVWIHSFTTGTGGAEIKYVAKDRFGKTTPISFRYIIDTINPEVTLTSPAAGPVYIGTTLSTWSQFSGTANDPGDVNSSSGINHVEYSVDGGTNWANASGTTSWSANVDFSTALSATKVLFKSVDNGGLSTPDIDYKSIDVVIDQVAPVITITGIKSGDKDATQVGTTYYVGRTFKITGKVTEKYRKKIEAKAGEAGSEGVLTEGVASGDDLPFTYDVTLTADGTYSYTFNAVDMANQTAIPVTITVYVDTVAPVPAFSSVTPVVEISSNEYVNGKIKIQGTSSDNDKVVNTVLNCYVAGTEGAEGADYPVEPTKVLEAPAGEADRFTFEINTAEFTDKRNLKLELISTDRAGNVTAKDTKLKIVYIDQDTDKPVITLSNASTDVTEASGINLTTNLFEKTGKILGTITDDDAVGTVTAYYKKSGTSDEFAQFFTANPGTATYNLSAALSGISSLAEGEYEIKINVSDTKTDGSSSVNTEIGPFLIAVDDYAPAIAVTTPQNGWYSTNATVTGTASDASGIKSISSSKSAVSTSDTFANWQEDFTVGQKGETVTYTATDKYGRTGTAKFTYKVDILAPSVSVTTEDVKAYLGTTFTTTKTFAGTATDPASVESITSDVSGVTRVEYIIKASGVPFADDDVWTSVSGTTKWNANIDFGTIAGDYDVYFRAVDNADNVTAAGNYVKRSVTVDADVPAFSDMTVQYHNIDDDTWVDITEQDGTYYSKGNYTIKGTITDSNLKALTVTGVSENLSVDSDGKFTQSFTTSGTKQFKALDKAEQSTIKNFNIYIDTQDPNVEISAVTPQVTANGKENNVNGIITVTGNASDNDKITSTILSINGNDVTDKNGDVLVAYNERVTKVYYNESGMRYSYTIDTTKFSDKTNMTVGVKTFDRSGRVKSSTKELYIDQSTDIPVLSSSNFNLDATEAKENLFGMGMMTINVTAVDDDGVATFKYKIDDGADVELVTGGNSTSYSKAITFERTLTKAHRITFTIEDINGNVYTNSTAVPFAIDNDVPSIGNLKIIRTKDTIIYEENAFIPVSYKLSGTASDASGIESITIEGVNITGTDTWISDDITGIEGNNTVDVKATDIFGRTSYVTLKLIVDNTAPTWQKNNGTAQSPSLVNVDTKISGGTKNVLHTDLNKGKISWFNSENITLSGNAYDANGIAGYILTVNGNDSTANGTAAYSILAGYTQGQNTASLVVKDKAGNSAIKNFTIYVDTVVPEINEYAVKINDDSDYKYINASANVIVSVGATDVTSGINKILIGTTPGFSASDAIATKDLSGVTATDNKKICEIDISTVARAWSEGAHTIYIRAVDEAGLDSSESSITGLIVDKTAPAFTYTSHASNSDVNKIITLSGSITEENSGDSAELWYRTSAVGETAAGSWSKSNATVNVYKTEKSWKIEDFNTSTFTDNTKYDFQLRMTDAAGNKTAAGDGAFITLNINQNSDRPIIKLNFATDGTARLNSGKFAGTIADDDGDIKNLYFQVVTPKADGGYKAIVDDDAHWKELAVTSGAWEITDEQKLADGSYKIYFKVVDAKNEIFKTTGSDGLNVPYIQYSTNAKVYAPVEFSIDTEAPVISLVDVSLNAGSYLGSNIQNNKVMGGTLYKTAKFKVMAADAVSKGTDLTVQVKINTAPETVYDAIYDPSDRNYYTDTRDLSGIASGIYQLTVTATDKSGMAATFTRIVIIDNTAPTTIKNVVPNSTTEVTGAFTMSGLVQDDENANSGIPVTGAMQYYIPKFTEKDTVGDALADLNWVTDTSEVVNKITQTSVSWSIEFSALAEYIGFNQSTGAISSDYSGYVITENTDLYNIPVWFKVVDNAGNVAYLKDNVLKFNPNADKPKVEITYPGEKEKESDGKIIMGGTARFQGTASDNEGIEGVYLQFDMDGDGTFENGEGIGGVATNENGKVYAGGDKNNIAVKIPVLSPDTYGFKAKGSLSWSSSIDLSGITSETVKVRTIAIDSDTIGGQLASAWSETITITVNNDIPQIEDLILTKYKDSSYAEIEKQITYEEDIFISGNNWRLEGVAKHKDGIASITVDTGNSVTAADDSGNKKFAIPVNKSSGSWSVTITATENGQTTHPKSMFCNLNIDNTPPKFADGNGAGTQLVLFKDNYGSVANKLSSTVNVQNSNGQYVTLSAKATEDGSGFARAVIYFLRDGTSEDRVYNVMESYGASRDANKTVLSSLTPTAESAMEDGKVYVNSDNLIVLYKTGVTRSTKSEISFTGLGINKNIRAGGLVLINGVYRRISSVNGDTVTLNEEVDTSKTTVQFVYGMVIDNSGESRRNDGSIKADDDDGMVETYIKSGNDYTWEAEIPSANIPDGPIQIHVVLFDKAGNMNHSSVTTRVSNNAPRIARVTLATDLNRDGDYLDNGESQFFAVLSDDDGSEDLTEEQKNRIKEAVWNLNTKTSLGTKEYWTIKNDLQVIPEFVGGTAPFYWTMSAAEGQQNISSPETFAGGTSSTKKIAANKTAFVVSNSDFTSTYSEYEDKTNTYRFSFWDSTEETVPGSSENGSQWSILNVMMKQDVSDGSDPIVDIEPFYWHRAGLTTGNNTIETIESFTYEDVKGNPYYDLLYTNPECTTKVKASTPLSSTVYTKRTVPVNSLYETLTSNGHIEISDDLDFDNSPFTAENGVMDKDAKVSGKIVITGSAYDNDALGSLWFSVEKSGTSVFTAGNAISKTRPAGVGTNYVCAAEYSPSSGWNVASASVGTNNWKFNVEEEYLNQFGHKVRWTLILDTEHINGICLDDVSVNVIALDRSNRNASDTDQMDVVPYIKNIKTSLSAFYRGEGSVYARSAKGKYPIRVDDNFVISGFNLDYSETSSKLNTKVYCGDSELTKVKKTASENSVTVTLNSDSLSGDVKVVVNEIESLNNYNNNNAKGAFEAELTEANYAANAYNRVPNGINNNLLTDDVSLDVWEFIDAANPRNGKSDNPTMKISSQGRIGISFSNAVVYFSAPFIDNGDTQELGNIKSQTAIAQNYGWFTNNTFCFDQYGYPYAAAQSPDTDTAIGAAYLQFFSRKAGKKIGDMWLNENYQKIANSARIEAICIPINSAENDWTTDIDRTQSICMVTSMKTPTSAPSATNKVTVHMAYWDNLTKQIRYRQGKVGANPGDFGKTGVNGDNSNTDGNNEKYWNNGTANDSMLDLQGCDSSWGTQDKRFNHAYDSISNNNNNHVKGQKIYRVAGTSLGDGYANAYKVTTSHQGGRFVDIGVLSSTVTADNPTVVICWYDMINKNLVLSYDTPSSSDRVATDGMCTGNWATRAKTISNIGGMYCRMAIDANNGIHIAHYDNTSADLLYTFVPCVDNVPDMANAKTFTIDSFLSVGTWCTIDVAKVARENGGYNYVPQIGYFVPANQDTSASAKIARPVHFDSNGYPTFNGAVNDKFTGYWEVVTVPTAKIPIIDRVNVGVHKNGDGVQIAIPAQIGKTSVTSVVSAVSKSSYPVSDSTTVYGNGTMNPAVVYSVDDGPIQLAQRRGSVTFTD